jgi:hypothetical protein
LVVAENSSAQPEPEGKQPAADESPKPEHGADSQLRCYNATTWRLDQLFETDEPEESSK